MSLVSVAMLATTLAAPAGQSLPADSSRGAALRVYLLTFDSGAAVWERFGHNALWIHDPVAGTDRAYDYGRFSFGNNFVPRFAMGHLRYWMGSGDARDYLASYAAQGRQVWRQEFDLPPEAKAELQRFLEWNRREENRYYDYDYYLDNCSTRIRDALDHALGGALRRYGDSVPGRMTFRGHTRRLTQNNPLLYAALMAGLGQPVDRPTTAWDEMFLPIELRPHLNRLRVRHPDGEERPVVLEEQLLIESGRFPVPARPDRWLPGFLLVGVTFGSLLAGLARVGAGTGSVRARRGFVVGATLWSLVAGLGGGLLVFFWTVTDHRFSVANENVLQLSVMSLGLVLAVPGGATGAAARRQFASRLAGVVVLLSVLGLSLKATPWFVQSNLDVIAVALPIHLGLWIGLRLLAR